MENTFINTIDFKKLRSQKLALLKAIDINCSSVGEDLQGIVCLIDNLQDFAVDSLGIPEEKVFGINKY